MIWCHFWKLWFYIRSNSYYTYLFIYLFKSHVYVSTKVLWFSITMLISHNLVFHFEIHAYMYVSTVILLFTLKSILRQKKKNYGNSNSSSCKNIIFKKKYRKRNQNPSRYYNSTSGYPWVPVTFGHYEVPRFLDDPNRSQG